MRHGTNHQQKFWPEQWPVMSTRRSWKKSSKYSWEECEKLIGNSDQLEFPPTDNFGAYVIESVPSMECTGGDQRKLIPIFMNKFYAQ